MTYKLYIDVVFFVNFMMDYLLLSILRRILKLQKRTLRIVMSSGIGALWASLIVVFPVLPIWLEGIITYLVISSLMVFIAFRIKELRRLCKAVAGLYLTTVMTAGVGYFLYEHTKAGYYAELIFRGQPGMGMPVVIFLMLMAGSYFGVKAIWNIILSERKQNENFYSVILHYKGKTQKVTALLDTGNHLREPVSRKPVNVITYQACNEVCEKVSNVLMIPYQAVGTTRGMLTAVKIDKMEIIGEECALTIIEPLIAISVEPLSSDGRYEMLLHEEMFNCN